MNRLLRLSRSPILLGALISIGMLAGFLFGHPGHAAAANGYGCGVTTGDAHSMAGVIINLYSIAPGGSKATATQDNDDTVTIQTASPSSTLDGAGNPANVAKMSSDDGTELATVHQRTFRQVNADCGGNGYMVVLGYGKTSSDTSDNWDYWALDCDVSKHAGRYQTYNIWPNGVPAGKLAGGHWEDANGNTVSSSNPYTTSNTSQGANGSTFSLKFYYIEPQPHIYEGQFDYNLSCSTNTISVRAWDKYYKSNPIQAEVRFTGGPGGIPKVGPNYANNDYGVYATANHHRWAMPSSILTYSGNTDVTAKLYLYDQSNNIIKDSSGNPKVFDTNVIAEPCQGPPKITVAVDCTTKTLTGAAWDNDKFSAAGPSFLTVSISYEGGFIANVVANQAEGNGHTHGYSQSVASLYPSPTTPTTHTFTLVAKGVNSSGTADGLNTTITKVLTCGTPPTSTCAGQNTTPTVTLPETAPQAPGPYGYSPQSGATNTANQQYYYEHPVGYQITSAYDQWSPRTDITWSPTGEQASHNFTMDYTNYVNQYPYDDHNTTINYTEYFNETYQYSSSSPDYYTCPSGGTPSPGGVCSYPAYSYYWCPSGGWPSGSTCYVYVGSATYNSTTNTYSCSSGTYVWGACYTTYGATLVYYCSPGGLSGTTCYYWGTPWYNWHTGGTTNNKPSANAVTGSPQLLECYPRNFNLQSPSQTDVTGVTFDDYENPTQVFIGAKAAVQFTWTHGGWGVHDPMLVNGLNYNGTYYIKHADGSSVILASDAKSISVGSTSSNGTIVTNTVPIPAYAVSLPPMTVGDEVCAEFTIDPSGTEMDHTGAIVPQTAGGSVSSTPIPGGSTCSAPVQNQPYSRFYGNDVLAGVQFPGGTCNTSAAITSNSRGTTGSGSQFAAMSLGAINGFASAFLRGIAPTQPTGLSFSNTSGGTYKGNFASGSPSFNCTQLPDYMGDKPADSQAVASLSDIGSGIAPLGGTVAFTAPGGNLGSLSVPAGSNTSIFVNGDVYITGDISFDTSGWTYNSTDRSTTAPSLFLIVKGNIDIAPGVHRLDGVYVSAGSSGTGGTIRTCSAGSNSSFAPGNLFDACNSQLVVNGAFLAQDVRLDRSFSSLRHSVAGENPLNGPGHNCDPNGLTTAQDCSAEIFNFSPEVYLSNPALQPGSGPSFNKYDYITSLSPVL